MLVSWVYRWINLTFLDLRDCFFSTFVFVEIYPLSVGFRWIERACFGEGRSPSWIILHYRGNWLYSPIHQIFNRALSHSRFLHHYYNNPFRLPFHSSFTANSSILAHHLCCLTSPIYFLSPTWKQQLHSRKSSSPPSFLPPTKFSSFTLLCRYVPPFFSNNLSLSRSISFIPTPSQTVKPSNRQTVKPT